PNLLQVRDQIAHSLVAERCILLQAFSNQLLLAAAAMAEAGAANRRRLGGQDSGNDLCRTLRLEGPTPAQQFIKHSAEAEDIAATIQLLAAHLLRPHSRHRAQRYSRYAHGPRGICPR